MSLTHDAARRVERDGFRPKVWRYKWDGKDRLVACIAPEGQVWRYAYDPFGRRVSRINETGRGGRSPARPLCGTAA